MNDITEIMKQAFRFIDKKTSSVLLNRTFKTLLRTGINTTVSHWYNHCVYHISAHRLRSRH